MVHILTGKGDRPFAELTIQSTINVGEQVYLWFNDESDINEHIHKTFKDHEQVQVFLVSQHLEEHYIGDLNVAREKWMTEKVGSLAPYIDIIRLQILKEYGGWWIDDDLILLQKATNNPQNRVAENQDFIAMPDFSYHPGNKFKGVYPSNYMMGTDHDYSTIAGHLISECLERWEETENAPTSRKYIEFGPHMLYRMKDKYSLDLMPIHLCPSIVFLDLSRFTRKMTPDSFADLMFFRDSIGIHLTNVEFHDIERGSILDAFFVAASTGKRDPFGYVLNTYHEINNDFHSQVNEINAERSKKNLRPYLSIHELKRTIDEKTN